MGVHPILLISLGICILFLLLVLFQEKLISFLIRGILGGLLIYAINLLFPEYAIGINFFTLGCSGLLGIPGIATLYIVAWFI